MDLDVDVECDEPAACCTDSCDGHDQSDAAILFRHAKNQWPHCMGADYSKETCKGVFDVAVDRLDHLPDGPVCYNDFFDWPVHISTKLAECMGQEAVVARLDAHLRAGVTLTSHYSGMGTAEDASTYAVSQAAAVLGVWPAGMRSFSTCDLDPNCRHVLLTGGCSEHVFGDLVGRLPKLVRKELTSTLKRFNAKLDQKLAALPPADRRHSRPRLVQRLGQQWCRAALKILDGVQFTRAMTGYCHKHRRKCACFPELGEELHIEISGSTCVAWSAMSNKSLGWLDSSSIACLTWAVMMRGIQPHIIIHECVARFDYTELANILGPSYSVESVVFNPTNMGLPVLRRRRYTICRLVDGPSAIEPVRRFTNQHFKEVAFRNMMVDARVFFQAAAEEQCRVMQHLASRRHVSLEWCLSAKCSWSTLLSTGTYNRLASWARHAAERFGLGAGETLPFMVLNISQNPEFAKTLTNIVPALLRSSQLIVATPSFAWRPAVPEELLAVQGLPVYAPQVHVHSPQTRAMLTLLQSGEFSQQVYRSMIGNSMHHAAVGAVALYALLCTERS